MDNKDIIGIDPFVSTDELPTTDVEETADEGLVGLDTRSVPRSNSMIRVLRFEDAPKEMRALSNHGGDEEHVIIGTGKRTLHEIMEMRDIFDSVVRGLDVWDLGQGTVHTSTFEGESCIVYITAHA